MKIDCRLAPCIVGAVLALLLGWTPVRAGEIIEVGSFQVELLGVGESAQGGAFYALGYPDTITGTSPWTEEQKASVVRSLAALDACFDTASARPVRIAFALRSDLPPNILGNSASTRIYDADYQSVTTTIEAAWRDGLGDDLYPETADDLIQLSVSFPFHYAPQTPAYRTLDFQSLINHEIIHAMGITKGYFGPEYGYYYGITRWDSFLSDVNGNVPMPGTTGYPDPMTVIGPEGTVYWTGEYANTTYGGAMPIYTNPETYLSGSTMSHIAGEGGLMNWALRALAWDRAPDKLLLDVFRDLGWSINMDFYNAFGPVFYKDNSEIRYSGNFLSAYDYATVMLVSGSGNMVDVNGNLETRGDFTRALYLLGNANHLDFTGSILASGDSASGVYVYSDTAVINQDGIIDVSGTDSYGLHLLGYNCTVNNSGTIRTDGTGAEAIRLETPYLRAYNTLNILNGSDIEGNIVNTAPVPATLSFGYDVSSDGEVVGVDPAFLFQFDDDIVGLWTGYLGGGLTILNGNAAFETLTVTAPATLGGSGVITGTVLNEGLVSPGNSIDTLTIDGDYTQTGTGSLHIEAGGGASDRLVISGTADIQGGGLYVTPLGYLTDGTYEFLTASTVTGGFDSLWTPAVFQTVLDDSVAGSLLLDISRNTYAGLGLTGTQKSLGSALDTMRPDADGDMADILNRIDGLSLRGVRSAMDDLGPAFLADVTSAALDGMRTRNDLLWQQIAGPEQAAGDTDHDWRFWSSGLTANRDFDATSEGPAFRTGLDGLVLGLDRSLSADLRIGFAGAFTRSDIDEKYGSSAGSIESVNGYLYSTWKQSDSPEGFHGQAAIQMGHDRYESERAVSFLGRTTRGTHSGWQASALLGGGYDWSMGDWRLGALASVQYLRLDENGFSEHGADAANLHVGSGVSQSMLGTWGLRAVRPVMLGQCLVVPTLQAEWMQTFWTDSETMSATFLASGESFEGAPREDKVEALKLHFSLDAALTPNVQAQLAYEHLAQANGGYGASQASAGVKVLF
jgi:uncharacterized protein with beta-barrel porin domain